MSSMFPEVLKRFRSERRGNVAMMFALSLVPMMGMAGGAVDYAVASQVHAQLQSALDSTALSVARTAGQMTPAQVQDAASARFTAAYQAGTVALKPSVTASVSGNTLTVTGHTGVKPSFLGVLGIDAWPIEASSSSVFKTANDQTEIALVLDNTGSMGDNNKMTELKKAVNNLIDKLQSQSTQSSKTKVSIVPFNTQVQIGTGYRKASWLKFGTAAENVDLAWVRPATVQNWTGCVTDRDQSYDTLASAPAPGQSAYVAFPCVYPGLSPMMPLTRDLESVRRIANTMYGHGATNVTVGFTMGLSTLRSDSPFGGASPKSPSLKKFLILLTDGRNTQNRWGGNGSDPNGYMSEIDKRLQAACGVARSTEPVHVFTIRVIEGNAALLRDCATDPASYYDVRNAAELQPVFDKILNTINGIRLSS